MQDEGRIFYFAPSRCDETRDISRPGRDAADGGGKDVIRFFDIPPGS